jgi:carbonic anhydrase
VLPSTYLTLRFNRLYRLEQSVLEDIELVRASPLIRKELADRTRGFIYDIKTGEVKPVAVSGQVQS